MGQPWGGGGVEGRGWTFSGAFTDEFSVKCKYSKGFAGFSTEKGWLASVNDLKSKIASGVVFAGFDGGLPDSLDWWAGIRYYNSPGRGHCSPGHTGKMLG